MLGKVSFCACKTQVFHAKTHKLHYAPWNAQLKTSPLDGFFLTAVKWLSDMFNINFWCAWPVGWMSFHNTFNTRTADNIDNSVIIRSMSSIHSPNVLTFTTHFNSTYHSMLCSLLWWWCHNWLTVRSCPFIASTVHLFKGHACISKQYQIWMSQV